MKKIFWSIVAPIFVCSFYFAQDQVSYNGNTYRVYPHSRNAFPNWELYSAINRDNKENIKYLYNTEVGEVPGDEEELMMNLGQFEYEIFGEMSMKLKKKEIQYLRENALYYFGTNEGVYNNITPSIDPLPDGAYIQYYSSIFTLTEKGDIVPKNDQTAGFFTLKNNLIEGFAYWVNTAGDTIEKGYYVAGQKTGLWEFKNFSISINNVTDRSVFSEQICEFKEGLLDGPYLRREQDTTISKGFYTKGEPSGEWFNYENYAEFNEKNEFVKMNYYLMSHFTYAEENPPVVKQLLFRDNINSNLRNAAGDSLALPDDPYQTVINFNNLYRFFKPEVEDLELPEEKITSYDGEESYDEGMYIDDFEGDMNFEIGSVTTNGMVNVKGKYVSKNKIIDSVGIQFLYRGVYETFHTNGKLKYRYEFKDGKLVNESPVYWDNGNVANTVSYDASTKEHYVNTYDYNGVKAYALIFDSVGNFVKNDLYSTKRNVKLIEGLETNIRNDRGATYYNYSNWDTLLNANLVNPEILYKSWYHNESICSETTFDPASRTVNTYLKNIGGNMMYTKKRVFGEDYSFVNEETDVVFRNLKTKIVSNGNYEGGSAKDSLPQSKIYFTREFNMTEDATVFVDEQLFNGAFELNFNEKSPSFKFSEKQIQINMASRKFHEKLFKQYVKKIKSGQDTKTMKYMNEMALTFSYEFVLDLALPFYDQVLQGIFDNGMLEGENRSNNGRITKVIGQFKDGKPHGKWTILDNQGKIKRELFFENGEREGEEKTYAYQAPKFKPKKKKFKNEEEFYIDYEYDYYGEEFEIEEKPAKETYYLNHIRHFHKDQLNGLETYYNWKGELTYSVNFVNGYEDGIKMDRNKYVTNLTSYKDGLLDGISQTKLTLPGKDTLVLFDLNFQNHQLQGESKAYHPSGKLAKRGFFLNNEPIDDYEAYDTLGFKYHYVKFQYSFPVEEKIWEENELSVRYLFDWQDSIYFKPNDLIDIPSTYDLLMDYGLMDSYALEAPYMGRPSIIDKGGIKYHVTKYFPDQVISRDGPIVKGKKTGCWYYNSYTGRKLYEIEYFDTILKVNDSIKFKAKGIRTDLDSLGNPLHISWVVEKIENYDCSHTDHYEVRQFMTIWEKDTSMHRMNGYVKNYYDDGTLQSEGLMKNGLPTGVWKYYTPNGQLNQVGEYVMGKRNGRWLKGDLSKTNYMGDICLNPNLPDLEERIAYQENLLDINIRYFHLGKIINSEFYDINMNKKK